ncbi:MAG: sulfotransferase [Planctomycetota bacterium]
MKGPVVIGALGGSGTRAVARICEKLGVYQGKDLNEAHDNLSFTLLFKRPRWIERATEAEIETGLTVLEKVLGTGIPLERDERRFVRRAAFSMCWRGHDHKRRGVGLWPFLRARRILKALPPRAAETWGFKEPNSHVFLEHLARRFPSLRFIYVVRHGLDMAYTNNLAQLHNWGRHFGVEVRGTSTPAANLAYWVAATQRATELGRELLGDRFLKLDFDRLCRQPELELASLTSFLGKSDVPASDLTHFIRPPSSMGRYRQHDWRSFDPALIDAVREQGFEVD